MKIKYRIHLFILLLVVSIISLIYIAPVMFNFTDFFGIGEYDINHKKDFNYEGGTGIVETTAKFDFIYADRYSCRFKFDMKSSGSVNHVGFINLTYRINRNEDGYMYDLLSWDPPIEPYGRSFLINQIVKNDIITLKANFTAQFIVNGLLVNETYSVERSVKIVLSSAEHGLIDGYIGGLIILYLLSYIFIPLILYGRIRPQLSFILDEELVEEDEKFYDYISKKKN